MLVATIFMPHALRGILLAGFMAAFMSTLATQFNWGSSYLVEDFYRRFYKNETPAKSIMSHASRLVTAVAGPRRADMFPRNSLRSAPAGSLCSKLGAGTGGVYLLRWYWWRINAWSEISAMTAALVTTLALISTLWNALPEGRNHLPAPNPLFSRKTMLSTTGSPHWCGLSSRFSPPRSPTKCSSSFIPKCARNQRLEAVARLAADVRANARSGNQFTLLDSWMRDGLFGAIRIGKLCFGFYPQGFDCSRFPPSARQDYIARLLR